MLKNKLMKEVWMNTWKYQEVINNEQKNPFSLKSTFLTLQQQILKFLLISQLRHGMDIITKIKYFQNMLWKFPKTSQQQFCPWSTGVSAITMKYVLKHRIPIWLSDYENLSLPEFAHMILAKPCKMLSKIFIYRLVQFLEEQHTIQWQQ